MLVSYDPVCGREQFEAKGGLEAIDQLGDAIESIAGAGMRVEEGAILIHGAGQEGICSVLPLLGVLRSLDWTAWDPDVLHRALRVLTSCKT
jgi:hypothetical protein